MLKDIRKALAALSDEARQGLSIQALADLFIANIDVETDWSRHESDALLAILEVAQQNAVERAAKRRG